MDIKIILRIQKLLALANDTRGNEEEANSAMEKAHAIMAEHNLTMATIAATGKKEGEARSKESMDGQAMFDYQRDLMAVIAETNYCYVSVIQKYTKRGAKGAGYRLIGTESNVATAKAMFEYLMQTINRLVMNEIDNDYRRRMSRWAISWCTGCAERLRERITERHNNYLAEQKRKAKEAEAASRHPSSASRNALVVIMEDYAKKEVDLNNDFRNGWEPGTTVANRVKLEAQRKERKDKRWTKAKAEGFSDEVARVFSEMFHSFSTPEEAAEWLKPEAPMSEEEKAKQEKRWEREDKRERTRSNREFNKRDWAAHNKGSEAGSKIGLDAQIGKSAGLKSIK